MSIKVSIVVAAYNTGEYIEPLIDSIVGQTLPADEFEAIFVDDGSTDATPQRLDDLAAEQPNIRVEHIPNSGWPGKPRNIGTDMAEGEYIYFVDHDDWLGPEALERMYSMGIRTESDIVIGKIAGYGRRVPISLFKKNYEHADVESAPVVESMTPHKMFRREFLNERGIRFPEGKRRLEDHLVCAKAYLQANGISVLGDYACYHHIRREDAANAGFGKFKPADYYGNLREAIDAVEELTEPGPRRNVFLRRWYRTEMLKRVGGAIFAGFSEEYRRDIYNEVRRLAEERFTDPEIWRPLTAIFRIRSELVRADRYDDLLSLAQYEAGISTDAYIQTASWDAGALDVVVRVTVHSADGKPLELEAAGDDLLLGIPIQGVSDEARNVTGEVAKSKVKVISRKRGERETASCRVESVDGRRPNQAGAADFTYSARIDTAKAVQPGVWDIEAQVTGWVWPKQTARVAVPDDVAFIPALIGDEPRVVVPYATDKGNLTFDMDQRKRSLPVLLGPELDGVDPSGEFRAPVSIYASDTSLPVTVSAESDTGDVLESVSGSIMSDGANTVVAADFAGEHPGAYINLYTESGKGAKGRRTDGPARPEKTAKKPASKTNRALRRVLRRK